jgi:hypothetical protein
MLLFAEEKVFKIAKVLTLAAKIAPAPYQTPSPALPLFPISLFICPIHSSKAALLANTLTIPSQ